jgi:hypothetical protein
MIHSGDTYIALHSDEQDAAMFNGLIREHLASRTSGVSECLMAQFFLIFRLQVS